MYHIATTSRKDIDQPNYNIIRTCTNDVEGIGKREIRDTKTKTNLGRTKPKT